MRNVVSSILFASATLVSASAQTLSGSLFGTVTDEGGGRLPGVTVTISSPQLITARDVRTTSEQGTYRFPTLPPGTYSLTFELPGFQITKREGIVLLAGQSLAIDAQLTVASVQESVIVSGDSPLVDTRHSALVNTADARTLENLPVERDFTKLANLMPGVTDGKYEFAPVNAVHGGTVRQNLYSLDGVNVDDPGNNMTTILFAVDSLQEVQVTTAGITAEFGDASGALINYVTKSGSNEFHGGANLFYQGKDTQANNVSQQLREQGIASAGGFEDYYDSGALLGGPVNRNRTWFFANWRYVDLGVRRPDFSVPIETTEKQLFTKVTLQATMANQADVGFFFRDSLEFPFGAAATFRTRDDPRTWDANAKRNYILNPRWRSVLGGTTLFEARGSFAIYEILAKSPNSDGSPAYVDVVTGIISGGSAQPDGDNRRNRHEFKADLSHFREDWLAGSHSFKTGFSLTVTPYWFTHVLKGARGDSPLELVGCSRECISATPGVQHLLFNGAPFRVRLYNSPARLSFETRKWAYYAQDQWVLADRMTLNLGVRIDHTTGDILESQSGGGRWDALSIFPARPGLIDITSVAPRAGLVWDVSRDHRTALKVSAGRFYNQLNAGYLIPANAGAMGFREFDWNDRNSNAVYDVGEQGLLRADTRPNPARLPTIDPDLKNQYTDVFTAGLERQLASDFAFAVTGIFKRDGDLIGLVNNAVPFSAYNSITVRNPLNGEPLEVFTLRREFLGRPGQLVLTNPGERPGDTERLQRGYRGIEVVFRRRLVDSWRFETSYVFGDGESNVNNHFGRSDFADYTNPNFLVNRLGDLTVNPRHQFKLHGTYLAPHGISFSGYFEALSGLPLSSSFSFLDPNLVRGAATVRVFQRDFPNIESETFIDVAGERAGTRQFDAQTRLDLRIEKKWTVGKTEIATTGDVFNVFNSNTVTRVNDLRLDSTQFARPAEIQPPRQLRGAVRWSF